MARTVLAFNKEEEAKYTQAAETLVLRKKVNLNNLSLQKKR